MEGKQFTVKVEVKNLEVLKEKAKRLNALTEEVNALINEISNLVLEPVVKTKDQD